MRLVTYLTAGGSARAGALVNETAVLDLAGAAQALGVWLPADVLGLLELGPSGLEQIGHVPEQATRLGVPAVPLTQAYLLAPIPRPRKLLAVAGNYADHLIESRILLREKSKTTLRPFIKPSNSVIGPEAPVKCPGWSATVDYEAELAIVIGRRATAVSVEQAIRYIAGYSILNDISCAVWPRPRDNRRIERSAPPDPFDEGKRRAAAMRLDRADDFRVRRDCLIFLSPHDFGTRRRYRDWHAGRRWGSDEDVSQTG